MKIYHIIIPLFIFLIAFPVVGQTKFKAELFSFAGREHNVFKTPDYLFDLASDQYFGQDSLKVSDFFIDAGLDLNFQKTVTGKSIFGVGLDYWNRFYFQHSEANQSSVSADLDYERRIGKSLVIGAAYDFSLNDKIGTSITGDELLRSFKYLGNYGDVYLLITPSNKWELSATGSIVYKNYFADTTEAPLDHINLETELASMYQMNKKHGIKLELSYTDRNYKHYTASDSLGLISPDYPLRHYKYYDLNAAYEYRPLRGFLISPNFGLTRRRDLYQDYYGYFSYDVGVNLWYMKKKIYVYLSTSYRNVAYDQRYAYTYIESSQLLNYEYLKYKFKVKYKIIPALELFLNVASDNRDSNTELEHARTRRPYNNYEMMVGFTIIPFDYNSKYD